MLDTYSEDLFRVLTQEIKKFDTYVSKTPESVGDYIAAGTAAGLQIALNIARGLHEDCVAHAISQTLSL